jgi:hypothetical protein
MIAKLTAAVLIACCLAACGDKVPESEEAKKIGNIPKQTIDKTKANLDAAMQQAGQRTRDEEEKQDQAGKQDKQ